MSLKSRPHFELHQYLMVKIDGLDYIDEINKYISVANEIERE